MIYREKRGQSSLELMMVMVQCSIHGTSIRGSSSCSMGTPRLMSNCRMGQLYCSLVLQLGKPWNPHVIFSL